MFSYRLNGNLYVPKIKIPMASHDKIVRESRTTSRLLRSKLIFCCNNQRLDAAGRVTENQIRINSSEKLYVNINALHVNLKRTKQWKVLFSTKSQTLRGSKQNSSTPEASEADLRQHTIASPLKPTPRLLKRCNLNDAVVIRVINYETYDDHWNSLVRKKKLINGDSSFISDYA